MSKILIIGAGFGGLTVVDRLCKSKLNLDLTLIGKKQTSDFLPMLPDLIGRGINPEFLTYRIEAMSKKSGFKFINEEVISIDLEKKEVSTKANKLKYDYLVIASGSETNFYGNENIKNNAYKLDDVEDAKIILNAIRTNEFDNFIIGGGGYTGIEVAANLRVYLNKVGRNSKITVVERSPAILGSLPEWMKNYVSDNLKELNIEVCLNCTIEKIEGHTVYLSGDRHFNKALVIWAAGVKTAGFIQNLAIQKNPQGRIKVDEFLRINNNCFVIGDVAYFSYKGIFLRMAVQFAIAGGECVAHNIINSVKGLALSRYKPMDLGYIIPMANNKSCGKVLGINLKGFLPTILHFIMCIYRSWSFKNKWGIIKELMKGGA